MDEVKNVTELHSVSWWETGNAARYMAQLCKHFAHKLPVTLNERDGQIVFTAGVCDVAADETGLRLRASAEDEVGLQQVQSVVIRHLQRFAFREMNEEAAAAIEWMRVSQSPS
ncbi:DUF2218 domain-containing protein [Acidisoma sp.]|uniref:DUF2218 domain-containing protein n=1 Tax=Acidisoma sp. TaxID=1872115 RepID=UPI003AFF6D71